MDRFRPNIVVEGCAPYSEDRWDYIRIGGASFVKLSRCPRCTVPDVEQARKSTAGIYSCINNNHTVIARTGAGTISASAARALLNCPAARGARCLMSNR